MPENRTYRAEGGGTDGNLGLHPTCERAGYHDPPWTTRRPRVAARALAYL